MKRFIPTIILVIICIGAFWYASSQSFFKEEEEQIADQTMAPIIPEEAASIKLLMESDATELQRKDDQWTMTQPSALPLAPYEAESWLNAFGALSHAGEVDANPADLSDFGLTSPSIQFEVALKNGSVKTIQIGSPLPIAGFYYAKLKESPAVYKVAEEGLQGLFKAPIDFMQKLPIVAAYNDVVSVAVSWNGASKTLIKSDTAKTANESAWKLGDKELAGTDATTFLDKVILMSTQELVKPASEVKQDNPELKLTLALKKDGAESTNSYTGKVDGENVWIIKQNDNWAYAIPTATVQEMFDIMQ
ncbi:MAG: hypothetical protein K0R67_130 [Paenibacillus sp.]|jgi:hypothetical protein|nr:hypothetical protein [Paenibacillus sp.]